MADMREVYEFKRKHKAGFTYPEIKELLKLYPDIDMKRFNNHMMGHTCPIIDGEMVIYVYDVARAIEYGITKRDLTDEEFD